MNLNSVLIGSEDPRRLKDYYAKLFGEPQMHEGPFVGWKIGSGFLSLGPHDQVKGRNASPGRILWNIETPDVKSEFERLREAGGIVVQEPYAPGDEPGMLIATFADPDDNYFQLMSPFPG